MQIGSPEELQNAPATPFVLHFIDDVNQMPANCQFVKRMGYKTEKPYVMCRPTVFDVSCLPLAFPLRHLSQCFRVPSDSCICAANPFLPCHCCVTISILMQVSKEVPRPDMPKFAPATVSDRIDIGFSIKYMLKFDDGVVSGERSFCPFLLLTTSCTSDDAVGDEL